MNKNNERTVYFDGGRVPVVDTMPRGFVVWNIGPHAPAGHVLICRCEGYNVIKETIKAVELPADELEIIDRAAAWGNGNLDECVKILKRKTNGDGYVTRRRRETAAAALPIFRRICEPTNPTDDAQEAATQEAHA